MSNFIKKIFSPAVLFLIVFCTFAQSVSIRAQSCVQTPADLVSWWKADGDALDTTSKNNGTLLGSGAATVAGYNGKAFSLTQPTDAVGFGSNPPTLAMTSMTFEAWIYKTENQQPGALQNIFADWFGDAAQDSFLLSVYNDNGTLRLFGAIGDGVTGDNGFWGGTISLNTWTHAAMTYNSSDGTNKLYINGAEVASRVRPNGIFNGNNYVYLGREFPNLDRYYKGLIDEASVYSRALSAAEIQAIYNARQAGKCKPRGIFSQNEKTSAFVASPNSFFGTSVAISGEKMVVGIPGHSNGVTGQSGSVEVYVKQNGNWALEAWLVPSDAPNTGDAFGYSVAMSGDLLVVGSLYDDDTASNSGAVYVYAREGDVWEFKQKLKATDGAANDEFGKSVATNGNTIVVGAHGADQGSEADAGAVYVFTKNQLNNWTQVQKFIPTESPVTNDRLGTSVAISGETIVAGAMFDTVNFNPRWGSAYVYVRNNGTWTQQQKLNLAAIGGYGNANFGTSVAIDGDRLVVGAPGEAVNQNEGFAYVFGRNGTTWNYEGILAAADGANIDYFGTSVVIKGDTIAVGAPNDDTFGGDDTGAAYTFTRTGNTWTQKQKLTSSEYSPGINFGASMSFGGNNSTLAVGAYRYSNNNGAVFTFNRQPKNAPFDFDGDGKTDISIFRPSLGQWWYLRSSDGGNYAAQFGNSSDKLVPADYTGDGKTDIAFWRPSSGEWFVLRSEDGTFYSFPFGTTGDTPQVGDFDSDGRADTGVFRPSNATWFVRRSSDGGATIQQFGAVGDVPVASDYDGDGKTDLAIFRPSSGQWWLNRTTAGTIVFSFGNSADKLVQGDYTGDGRTDVAFWRPVSGEWFVLRSEDSSFYSFPFGASSDVPAPGDYDGDGKIDATVFRPSGSTWFVNKSTGGNLIQTFGQSGDKPIPSAFVP